MIFYHTEARFVKQDAAFFRQAALFPAGKCFFDRRRVPRHSIRGNPPSREISHAILKAADEPRRDSLSPAGSVRARENDPRIVFSHAPVRIPDLTSKTKKRLKGVSLFLSLGYGKDGFAFLMDGFELTEMMDRGFEGSKIPSNGYLSTLTF